MARTNGYQEAIQIPILFELTYAPFALRNEYASVKPIDEFHGGLSQYFPEASATLKKRIESRNRTRLYTSNQYGLKKLKSDSPHLIDWVKYESYDVTDQGMEEAREEFVGACRSATDRGTIEELREEWSEFASFLKRQNGDSPVPKKYAKNNDAYLEAVAALKPREFRMYLRHNQTMRLVRSI